MSDYEGRYAHLKVTKFTSQQVKIKVNPRNEYEARSDSPQFGAVGVPPGASHGWGHFLDLYNY